MGIPQHRQCRKSWVGPRGLLGAGGLFGTIVLSVESQSNVIGQGVHETMVKKVAVVGRRKEGTDSRNQDRGEWGACNPAPGPVICGQRRKVVDLRGPSDVDSLG